MSAVDAPPGIAFAGRAAGEFVSRTSPRRLSRVSLYYVVLMCVLTLALVVYFFAVLRTGQIAPRTLHDLLVDTIRNGSIEAG